MKTSIERTTKGAAAGRAVVALDGSPAERAAVLARSVPVVLLPETHHRQKPDELLLMPRTDDAVAQLRFLVGRIAAQGFKRVMLCLAPGHKGIRRRLGSGHRFGVTVDYVENDRRGAASPALPPRFAAGGPCILVRPELAGEIDFVRLLAGHLERGFDATIVMREYKLQVPYGVLKLGSGYHLEQLVEKPVEHYTVSAGICVVDRAALAPLPAAQWCDMSALFAGLTELGAVVGSVPLHLCRARDAQAEPASRRDKVLAR